MMKPWTSLKTFFILLLLLGIFSAPVLAQSHSTLTPLLGNLPGWQAEKADGMSMETGGMRMINATRSYTKGSQELNAVVMVGSQAMTMGQMQQMKMETDDVRVKIETIDGYKVNSSYNKHEKSGGIMVVLGSSQASGAMFMLNFEGMDDAQALKLSKKFDWKAMKKATAKLF
jgi:hypothetical protein